ncbi:MAG TPA: pirin family protein [Burkholderiaceae bacterium]|nr:pirin family protein [Burkholderiaceae bacterium]
MKKVLGVYSSPPPHWVGDGFPVRSLFTYDTLGGHISPFLLLDYAGPAEFEPSNRARGVGTHPHRGFETVTIAYQGEVAHRDSTGQEGVIGPGDVQWMTAASGIVHEEFHSPQFTRQGGPFEMVQLWVNLPAKDKMSAPGYQSILAQDIPGVALPDEAGSVRVIAGDYAGHRGPARTFSPVNVWDVRLRQGRRATFHLPPGHTAAVVVLRGTVLVGDSQVVREAQVALLEREGSRLELEANSDATLLILGGEPLNEPIVGYGPFVMNSEDEIRQAFEDFHAGRLGRIAA